MRSLARRGWPLVAAGALLASAACGFGTYDDGAEPSVTSSNSGVADAGMWWPWVCADGTNPSPASDPVDFAASGTCGAGGPFSISVNGCLLTANFDALGISQVETVTHSSTPQLGGWVISGVASADLTTALTCSASLPDANGVLTFICSDGTQTTCQSELTP